TRLGSDFLFYNRQSCIRPSISVFSLGSKSIRSRSREIKELAVAISLPKHIATSTSRYPNRPTSADAKSAIGRTLLN
ncbi:MAG TPA: hypothetical protein VFU31_24305, partial [Candidatus Binatia bacterium]|nr:hypothetical protein [Candidatus Binatia bacterium]